MNEDLATMRLRGVQNVVSSSDVPSFINQFRSGRQIQHIALGVFSRSDRLTMSEIDLFDLAITGEKTGTLPGAAYAVKFAIGEFVFLKARDKRLRLVRITSVGP